MTGFAANAGVTRARPDGFTTPCLLRNVDAQN